MHAKAFLHNLFDGSIHTKRKDLLVKIITTVINTKTLKLTTLGRAIEGKTDRVGIGQVNRLLANKYYHENAIDFYALMAGRIIGNKTRPQIIVDWSKLPNVKEYVLRASLSATGRALTLYEEIHPKKFEGNPQVQRLFLDKLKSLLPSMCRPIIVTDAGFKNPWFKAVSKLGWDYIGRVRGVTKYFDGEDYKECEVLHQESGAEAKCLGEMILTRKNPLKTTFYIVRNKIKGRKSYMKNGQVRKDKDSKNYSRSQREPWLLVSSLKGRNAAKKVIEIYKRRMTIEEAFRDMKSSMYGFSMQENKTEKRERLITWLLLAALASLLAWIVGYAAEQMKLHHAFQANSIRNRRVLSFFYLGCQVIRKKIKISIDFRKFEFNEKNLSYEEVF